MSQETRPQVYPLLPQNEGTFLNSGNEPTNQGSQVIALQPVAATENNPTAGRPNATTKATAKAGAYGGAELGSVVGNSICCCLGGCIGTCIGEKYGERAVEKSGLQEEAGKIRDNLGNVIGERNVDKAGEIALTAFGYGDDQFCICFPCMPSSQILLFIMLAFYIYNWYRIVIGIDFESGCTSSITSIKTENVTIENDNNTTEGNELMDDPNKNNSTWKIQLVEYPCEFGFEYMIAGAAVWLCFLPCYLVTLLGNCWRQCCCCLCDPLVCFATICDFTKRCLCECGKFSCINLVWYTMCIFQVIYGCCGLYWLVNITYFDDEKDDFKKYVDPDETLLKNVLACVILDITLAGSELLHKVIHYMRSKNENQVEEGNPGIEGNPA